MPSSSEKQRNYIFYLRGKYKSRDKAPEKWKWVFDKGWEEIEETFDEISPPIPMGRVHKEERLGKYKPVLK